MGFLRNLLKRKGFIKNTAEVPKKNEHVIQLLQLQEFLDKLLSGNSYIAKRDYRKTTMLIDVLSGTPGGRLTEAKLNTLPEFGKLEMIPKYELYRLIDWLIMNNYILKTKGQYPVLHQTYNGMHYRETMTVRQLKQLKKYLEMKQ